MENVDGRTDGHTDRKTLGVSLTRNRETVGCPLHEFGDQGGAFGSGPDSLFWRLLLVMRRCIGQFGNPKRLHSDNWAKFVGAERELREAQALYQSDGVSQFLRGRRSIEPSICPEHRILEKSRIFSALNKENPLLRTGFANKYPLFVICALSMATPSPLLWPYSLNLHFFFREVL